MFVHFHSMYIYMPLGLAQRTPPCTEGEWGQAHPPHWAPCNSRLKNVPFKYVHVAILAFLKSLLQLSTCIIGAMLQALARVMMSISRACLRACVRASTCRRGLRGNEGAGYIGERAENEHIQSHIHASDQISWAALHANTTGLPRPKSKAAIWSGEAWGRGYARTRS